MKKLLSISLLFFVTLSFSQRWSAYGIKVAPQNEETVVQIMNDYFSKNKIEGVTVSLYSIMFSPSELESTHEVIFSGEAEAMAELYTPEFQNMSWQLFATKINNFIEPVFSGNGWRNLNFGPEDTMPFQVVYISNVDWSKNGEWVSMQDTMRTKYPRNDISWATGGISVGGPMSEGNAWVVVGYPTYEDYLTSWDTNQKRRADNPNMVKEYEKLSSKTDTSHRNSVTRFMRLLVMQW